MRRSRKHHKPFCAYTMLNESSLRSEALGLGIKILDFVVWFKFQTTNYV